MRSFLEKFSNIYITFCVYALIGWIYEVLWMRYVVEPHQFINRGVLFGPFLPIYGFGMLILLLLLNKFMRTKHLASNMAALSVSSITIVTFIFTTIIEYTVKPKIYSVLFYLNNYGIALLLVNIFLLLIIIYLIKVKKISTLQKTDLTIILIFLLIWIITTAIEYISHFAIDKLSHKMLWDYTYDFLNINKRVNWDASRNFAIGGTFLLYTIQPIIERFLSKCKPNKKIIVTIIFGIPMLIDFILNVV